MLYLSNTQLYRGGPLGFTEGAADRGDFGLMQWVCPVDMEMSVSVEFTGNPMMAREGSDGAQLSRAW